MRRYELEINGKEFTVTVRSFSAGTAELEVDGARYTVDVGNVVTEGPKPSPIRPSRSLAQEGAAAAPPAGAAARDGSVRAPIPGQILKLLVEEGDQVETGKPVMVMEAMKMENVINAPSAGTVGKILVNAGDAVTQGQELMIIG